MNHYEIDYQYGKADFWTPVSDEPSVLRQFGEFASHLFGIRKSLGELRILSRSREDLPAAYAGRGGTHALHFQGDEYLFDDNWRTESGQAWRLHDAWGHDCTCAVRGTPDVTCEVHDFDAEHEVRYQHDSWNTLVCISCGKPMSECADA